MDVEYEQEQSKYQQKRENDLNIYVNAAVLRAYDHEKRLGDDNTTSQHVISYFFLFLQSLSTFFQYEDWHLFHRIIQVLLHHRGHLAYKATAKTVCKTCIVSAKLSTRGAHPAKLLAFVVR